MSDKFRSERDEDLLALVKAKAHGRCGEVSGEDKRSMRKLAHEVDVLANDLSGPCDFAPALLGYLDDHYYPEFGCKHGAPHTDHRPGCTTRVGATWEGVAKIVADSEDHYRIDREWYDERRVLLRELATNP